MPEENWDPKQTHKRQAAAARRRTRAVSRPSPSRCGPPIRQGRRESLRLAHGGGGARQPDGARSARSPRPKTARAASPRRGWPCRSRPRSYGPRRSRRGFRPTRCIRACWSRPIPSPRSNSRISPTKASCWCSTRSPIRITWVRSCARRRRSGVKAIVAPHAALSGSDRCTGEVRLRRARPRADRDGAKSFARAGPN